MTQIEQADPFNDGYRLIDGTQLNDQLANPSWSIAPNFVATPGGTVSNSARIVSTVTQVTTAATPNSGVLLPQALPGRIFMIINESINPIIVYGDGDSTLNGFPGNVGIAQQASEASYYVAVQVKQWYKLDFFPVGFPNMYMLNILDIPTLRLWANPPASSPAIIALVYNNVIGDGGGLFYLDVSDNTTPDNGTTVIVDAVGNRWKREIVSGGYIGNTPAGFVTSNTSQGAINQIITQVSSVPSITALRGRTPFANTWVEMTGYFAAGDGGGGMFYGVVGAAPGTYVDDGGSIVVPTGGNGSSAWILLIQDQVSVLQFGADKTGVAESTAAFTAAQAVSNNIYVPKGVFLLDRFEHLSGKNFFGDGPTQSIVLQKETNRQAWWAVASAVTSPPTYLQTCKISGILFAGKTGSTVATVVIQADPPYAIFDCDFEIYGQNGYHTLEVTCSANAVYNCRFNVSQRNNFTGIVPNIGSTNTGVITNGGVYNYWTVRISGAQNGRAFYDGSWSSTFDIVTTGEMQFIGQQCTLLNPTVEGWEGSNGTLGAIVILGTAFTVISGAVIGVTNAQSGGYAVYLNGGTPGWFCEIFGFRAIDVGGAVPNRPIQLGSDQSGVITNFVSSCPEKIESYTPYANMAKWSFLGGPTVTATNLASNTRSAPVFVATATYNIDQSFPTKGQLDNTIICTSSGTGAYNEINLPSGAIYDGRLLTFVTTYVGPAGVKAVAPDSVNRYGSVGLDILPTAAVGSSVTIQYDYATDTWFAIG